ncbi:MAG: glycosyltransferase family 39 protein [Microgenomates group bacterium]
MSILRKHKLIILIWIAGFFLRCYNQPLHLGFYYDQGRDAQVASDIISLKNLPTIGPTTGIKGLYLGPFWFYLITPGYLFGQGDPSIASYFIAFIESLTIPLIFYFVSTAYSQNSAYLASTIWAFSHYLIRSSRWFSNPSPLPTFVLLIMLLTYHLIKFKKFDYLPLIALLLGLSLQLEAASAVFFIPILITIFLLNISVIKKIKPLDWLKSIFAFFILLLPQLAFDIKNNFFITKNLLGFISGSVNSATGKTWGVPNLTFIFDRFKIYYQYLFSKIDTNVTVFSLFFLAIFLVGTYLLYRKYSSDVFFQIIFYWLAVPLFLLLFFVGNYGQLYDYYLTGFFPAFIILISLTFSLLSSSLAYLLLPLFAIYFIMGNIPQLYHYLTDGIDGPENIVLGNSLAALDFACDRHAHTAAGDIQFYVPPITPYTYDYLLNWRYQNNKCPPFTKTTNTVYALYEVDPNNPQNLAQWFTRFSTYKLLGEEKFGGVRVRTYRK